MVNPRHQRSISATSGTSSQDDAPRPATVPVDTTKWWEKLLGAETRTLLVEHEMSTEDIFDVIRPLIAPYAKSLVQVTDDALWVRGDGDPKLTKEFMLPRLAILEVAHFGPGGALLRIRVTPVSLFLVLPALLFFGFFGWILGGWVGTGVAIFLGHLLVVSKFGHGSSGELTVRLARALAEARHATPRLPFL